MWLRDSEQLDGDMKYAHGQARHRLLATKNLIRDQAGQHDRGLGGVHSDLDPVQGVVHPGLIRQLIACCSEEMRQSLSRMTGGKQFNLTETQLLVRMKNIAVRFQIPAVYVQQFLSLNNKMMDSVTNSSDSEVWPAGVRYTKRLKVSLSFLLQQRSSLTAAADDLITPPRPGSSNTLSSQTVSSWESFY